MTSELSVAFYKSLERYLTKIVKIKGVTSVYNYEEEIEVYQNSMEFAEVDREVSIWYLTDDEVGKLHTYYGTLGELMQILVKL